MTDFETESSQALRLRAEDKLKACATKTSKVLSLDEANSLLHELKVHQIELEMQNEELQRSQVELATSRERYHDLYELAPVGYLTFNEKGLILNANLTAAKLLGLVRSTLLTKPLSRFIIKEYCDNYYLHIKALRTTRTQQAWDVRMLHADGSSFWAHLEASLGQDGECRLTLNDISEYKRMEAEKEKLQDQIQQANKMQAVGTMAGGIAHEFNNMLAVIMGCTDMARDEVPNESFAKAQLDKVMIVSCRLKDLVKQILTFSRQGQQKRICANIASLVKESVKLIASSIPSSVEIQANIDSAYGNTMVDPTEIQQIVMNLFSNAVWAMKEKGVLTLSLNDVNLAINNELIPVGLSAGRYTKLTFRDTGCGMDQETISRIFDPFFTAKEVGQGTGMGLSIVYAIIKSYGGTITVESEIGKGSAFHLYFPVTDAPATEELVEEEGAPGGTERILFVDDEEMYAEMGAEMIGRLGYKVDLRTNSQEALEVFKTSPNKYDLVITDQIMPNLSGEELVKEIRSIRPEMPIIICTGYSTQMDEMKARSLGINAFAFKPIDKKDIAKLIRKVLDGC